MNWLAWLQHRKQFLIVFVLFAIYAAVMIPIGISFWHTYQSALSTCGATDTCSQLSSQLFQGTSLKYILFKLSNVVLILVPILLGIFWGAPLLAREYDEGTNKLVWTQSVSRKKWLTVKLLWILVASALFASAFALLNTWWWRTGNALYMLRFNSGDFDTQGIIPIAYTFFAVSLGVAIGAWFKRTMLAIGLTIAVLVTILVIFPEFIRPHYMTPITVTAPMGPNALDSKLPHDNSWVISSNIEDKNGKVFNDFTLQNMPEQCRQILQSQAAVNGGSRGLTIKVAPGSGDPVDACLNAAGYHQVAKYQPSYRYWDFQRIESGIFLAMSIIPIGATYWLVLRRDA